MKKPQMKEETRKKIDNFWYYYKIHVLVVVFILFVASVFIKDIEIGRASCRERV